MMVSPPEKICEKIGIWIAPLLFCDGFQLLSDRL